MGTKKIAYVNFKMLVWAREETPFKTPDMVEMEFPNISAGDIRKWESGKELPSITEAKKLAQIYKVPFASFFLSDLPSKKPRSYTDRRTVVGTIYGDTSYSLWREIQRIASKYENIGLIIFLRSDMAQNAITVNYEQFKQAFNYAELKWSSDEALKLAVWLVSHAVSDFYQETAPVENASQEVINQYLEKLWGLKLGKKDSNEAYSSRWILAALSDFNGQLQARDIIRFLKYASEYNGKKTPYNDRILMPAEIRNAVSNCSKDKITEIKAEYENLKPIFEKLENLPFDKKTLPMNLEEDALTATEEKSMIQSGYLTRDGEKLYLPEIIRHALGFRYERGARPRVLSLLLKH